ncbi:MAG TPA: hypothetical protein DEQ80_05100 [Anaerolinea thermolimosa]|uniref:Radical SAM protein n=1 Tax=Anaerolinea thermolimosa TaxID=229919 RepID=A0A3D1JHW8_9CHLR|nr:hypothetical protein [Anaerolinea thermolimosa]
MDYFNSNPGFLNIAAFCSETYALGPGARAAVWVQGCIFHCPSCIAPDWIPQKKAILIKPDDLANKVTENPRISGVTLSGGEPMLQAALLYEFLIHCKSKRDLDVILFTGFQYEVLLQKDEQTGIPQLLSLTDVLIDGPYVQAKNNGVGLRGSSNQRILYLTNRLKNQKLETFPRQIEYQFTGSETLIVGIPPLQWPNIDLLQYGSMRQERIG